MSKVMMSLPVDFLKDVDTLAKAEHRSRSELVREAIRMYIANHTSHASRQPSPEAQKAALRILKTNIRLPQGETAESMVRKLREARHGPTWTPSS